MISLRFKRHIFLFIPAFFALFIYLYPVAFKFLPCDTGMILHFIALLYFLIYGIKRFYQRFYQIFLWTLVLSVFGIMSTAIFNQVFDFSVIGRVISIILYTFSSLFVVDLIKKTSDSFSFYILLEWIIYAAILQALLSLILFFNRDLMSLYLDLIKQSEVAKNIALGSSDFRLIAISKVQYANMAVMYGIALLSAISLGFSGKSVLYHKKIIYYLFIGIIILVGIFSARTFFLFLGFSIFYLLYLFWKREGYKVIVYGFLIFLLGLIIFFVALDMLENNINTRTYKWMFEWYINWSENGSLQMNSTSTLHSMWYLPEYLKTWLVGDGRFYTEAGAFYKNTDVGYLRNLYYWGFFGSFLFYIAQYQFFKIVFNSTTDLLIKRFLVFIMIWILIYNIKEFWHANLYWTLFLAALLKVKK